MSVEALEKYGRHLTDCMGGISGRTCTCGFDAAIKAAQQPEPMSDERTDDAIAQVIAVQSNKVVPNDTFTAIVPHGRSAPAIGTKLYLSAQPDGWVRVPREPTQEMLDAICSIRFKQGAEMYREIYKTMVAAAQEGK